MGSAAGGVDIEEVAATEPEKLITVHVDNTAGFQPFQSRQMGFGMGLNGLQVRQLGTIMSGLYRLFCDKDLSLIEVNPLIIDNDGSGTSYSGDEWGYSSGADPYGGSSRAAMVAGAWCTWLSGSGPTVGMLVDADRGAAVCQFGQNVARDEDRFAHAAKFFEQGLHFQTGPRVETAGRLVEDQYGRVVD